MRGLDAGRQRRIGALARAGGRGVLRGSLSAGQRIQRERGAERCGLRALQLLGQCERSLGIGTRGRRVTGRELRA